MDWGIKNRFARIIKPETGRTVMLAVDHGYFLGPTSGLEAAEKMITPLIPYADSLMLTRGILRTSVSPLRDISIVLRVSGGNSVLDQDLSNEDLTVAMEDAIRLNVAAVAMSIYVGAEHQHRTIINLGELVDAGEKFGIPVLAVTAVGKEMVRDARYLGLCCRIAAEAGAHFVKTYYCEGFEKVVAATPVPIVVAGGKKVAEKDALELSFKSVRDGAVGVDMGRNIFQAEDPVAMIQAVRAVIHNKAKADEAFTLYNDLKKKSK